MKKQHFIQQLIDLVGDYDRIKDGAKTKNLEDIEIDIKTQLINRAKTAALRISGKHSHYYEDIETVSSWDNYGLGFKLQRIMGTIAALKYDVENDYLTTMTEMIHADLFTDYIEMADHLLEEGYKDTAAVIIGTTIESHLRKLCIKYGIAHQSKNSSGKMVNKKAELMNTELAKANLYNLTMQKQITAWLDIRNNAAHGNFAQYSIEQVTLMSQGIKHFLISSPA